MRTQPLRVRETDYKSRHRRDNRRPQDWKSLFLRHPRAPRSSVSIRHISCILAHFCPFSLQQEIPHMPCNGVKPLTVVAVLFIALTSLLGCRPTQTSTQTNYATIGQLLPRNGDEILVAGNYFHTGTPVVLWTDPGGYDA